MANILTLTEYKTFTGMEPTDNREDTRITALLPAATRAVVSFTDRSFDQIAGGVAAKRSFEYDGSGYLDIDDCTSISVVSTDAGVEGADYPLTASEWTAKPYDGEVYYYLVLHGSSRLRPSREMGFERNLDTIEPSYKLPQVKVTAVWGWPAVPEDVKLAAAWIIQDAIAAPAGAPQAEAIEGFSRSWGGAGRGRALLAVPNRARDLLSNYARVF